jgi:recombination protein RecA
MEKKTSNKKNIEHEIDPVRDDLAVQLAESLNKKSSDGKIAFFLDAQDDPSQIMDWISTGNDILDLAISNRSHGGVPSGRITELTGLEASGKSLLAAHLLATTQKNGGLAVFIDTEYAVSPEFLTAIGVDISKMLYINVTTVEDIFDNIEAIVASIRKQSKSRLVTIVVDSMAAASTKKEMASDHGADGYATGKAIAISKAMRKVTELIAKQRIALVFTNQLRQKIGFVGYGDPWTTSGGKALAFHASLRVRLKAVGKITRADKSAIGIKTTCTIIKNRMGPPMRSVEFDIYFDRGIDNYGNWLNTLIDSKIITNAKKASLEAVKKKKSKKEMEEEAAESKSAKSLQFVMEAEGAEPEVVVFDKKNLPRLLVERPDCKEYLYNKLCESYIMKYKTDVAEMEDDIEFDSSTEGMEE